MCYCNIPCHSCPCSRAARSTTGARSTSCPGRTCGSRSPGSSPARLCGGGDQGGEEAGSGGGQRCAAGDGGTAGGAACRGVQGGRRVLSGRRGLCTCAAGHAMHAVHVGTWHSYCTSLCIVCCCCCCCWTLAACPHWLPAVPAVPAGAQDAGGDQQRGPAVSSWTGLNTLPEHTACLALRPREIHTHAAGCRELLPWPAAAHAVAGGLPEQSRVLPQNSLHPPKLTCRMPAVPCPPQRAPEHRVHRPRGCGQEHNSRPDLVPHRRRG